MKYFIRTFGCQMNQADSERIALALEEQGYQPTKDIRKADLIIINSCIVRQSAENRVYGMIRNLNAQMSKCPDVQIILTGCLAGWAKNDPSGKNLRILRKKIGDRVKIVPTLNLIKSYNRLLKSGRSAIFQQSVFLNHPIVSCR